MRALPLLLIALGACGRIGFDPLLVSEGADAAAIPDGAPAPDAAPMFGSGPFGTPEIIAELSTSFHEDDPTLTGDMLEVYFKSERGGGTAEDIYAATRSSVSEPFGVPAVVAELSSPSVDNTPELSFDGLTITLSSNRDGGTDIYQATRATRSDPWTTPVRVAELSSGDQDYAAAVDGSGLHLVMTRIIAGNLDLFIADRAATTDAWNAPSIVSELATPDYQADAVLDERGLLLFYTAIVAGGGTNREIFLAERTSTTGAFGPGVALAELNTIDFDEDPWISPDLTTIYFVREAPGGTKDMYRATRPLGP